MCGMQPASRRDWCGPGADYRFEGASDPDDMSIVVGLRCRICGRTGVVVSAFGPDADPRLFDILNQIPIELSAHDPPH